MALESRRFAYLSILALLFIALFTVLPNANAAPPSQESPPNLLTDPETQAYSEPDPDPTVIRERLVNVHFDLLGGDGSSGAGAQEIDPPVDAVTLNLFSDVNLVAVLERVESLPSIGYNGYAWIGSIQGAEFSRVIFVVMDGITAANVRLLGSNYQIRPAADGLHVVREIDEAAFPEDDPDFVLAEPLPGETAQGGTQIVPQGQIGAAADDGSIIDVMVPYTADAKNGSGGEAAMHALIILGVVETNDSYANSSISFRIRLVHAYQVSYRSYPERPLPD